MSALRRASRLSSRTSDRYSSRSSGVDSAWLVGCVIPIVYMFAAYTVSIIGFREICWVLAAKQLPWYVDAIGGFFIPICVPVGFVAWVLSFLVHVPLIKQ